MWFLKDYELVVKGEFFYMIEIFNVVVVDYNECICMDYFRLLIWFDLEDYGFLIVNLLEFFW